MRLFIAVVAILFCDSFVWANQGFVKFADKEGYALKQSSVIPSTEDQIAVIEKRIKAVNEQRQARGEPPLTLDPSKLQAAMDMPAEKSQDTVGLCYAFTAATLVDFANCDEENFKRLSKGEVTQKCSAASDKERVSALDISRFKKVLPENADKSDRFNYEGLSLDGGATAFVLYNALNSNAIVKDSCAPFDQFVSKFENIADAQKAEAVLWKKLNKDFLAYKELEKNKSCKECLENFVQEKATEYEKCGIKAPQSEVLSAFAEKTYDVFLDKLLVPDHCWDFQNQLSLKGGWALDVYPKSGEKNSNYKDTLGKLKEVLKTNVPVTLEFCATQDKPKFKSMDKCKDSGHAVVITGSSQFCDKNNKNCVEMVRVQNTWGSSWKKMGTNDGWVKAKDLLDRSFYGVQTLTWLSREDDK